MKIDWYSLTELSVKIIDALGLDFTDDRMEAVLDEFYKAIDDGIIEVDDEG